MKSIKKSVENTITKLSDRTLIIIGFILCILVFLSEYKPYISNDTSFMILQAKNMIQNGIMHVDSATMHGEMLYYPQKWLMNFIVYFFYCVGGFTGLRVGAYVICIIKVIVLYAMSNYLNKGKPIMNTFLTIGII